MLSCVPPSRRFTWVGVPRIQALPRCPSFLPSPVGASSARSQILHLETPATAIGAAPSRFDASVARGWIHDSPHDPRH